jgi:predicted enzyme related to lactoylglutathione lyase
MERRADAPDDQGRRELSVSADATGGGKNPIAPAGTPTEEGVRMEVHFSRVDFLVNDMGKSLAFYRLLGFTFNEGGEKQRYVEIKTAAGFRVSWCQRTEIDGLVPCGTPTGHRIELAFRCPGREGVDATYERVIAAGYKSAKAPFESPWGQRYAFVEDPDGNLIGLEEHRVS